VALSRRRPRCRHLTTGERFLGRSRSNCEDGDQVEPLPVVGDEWRAWVNARVAALVHGDAPEWREDLDGEPALRGLPVGMQRVRLHRGAEALRQRLRAGDALQWHDRHGATQWMGRAAPEGVTADTPTSWLLCMMIVDALGWAALMPEATVPRPEHVSPDLTWPGLIHAVRFAMWELRTGPHWWAARMDMRLHWPTALQEELVARANEILVRDGGQWHGEFDDAQQEGLQWRLVQLAVTLIDQRDRERQQAADGAVAIRVAAPLYADEWRAAAGPRAERMIDDDAGIPAARRIRLRDGAALEAHIVRCREPMRGHARLDGWGAHEPSFDGRVAPSQPGPQDRERRGRWLASVVLCDALHWAALFPEEWLPRPDVLELDGGDPISYETAVAAVGDAMRELGIGPRWMAARVEEQLLWPTPLVRHVLRHADDFVARRQARAGLDPPAERSLHVWLLAVAAALGQDAHHMR